MNIYIFIIVILILIAIIILPIYLIIRSSQKTRREFEKYKQNNQNQNIQNETDLPQDRTAYKPSFAQDTPSIGISVLGFFFPFIGIIMYVVWLNSLPFRARSAGKGALIGIIVYFICIAIFILIGIGAFS